MISKLSIKNFKSIKEMDIDCARVNLFIGEPNTGKSNILESLGLLSWFGYRGKNPNEFIRFKNLRQLFHEGQINEPVQIAIEFNLDTYYSQRISIKPNTNKNYNIENQFTDPSTRSSAELRLDGQSIVYAGPEINREFNFIKFFRFKPIDSFSVPPHGSNLVSLISVSEKVRGTISQLSNEFGLKVIVRESENTIEFVKQLSDIILIIL
jgi:AAA15 family ATPase/GTPase